MFLRQLLLFLMTFGLIINANAGIKMPNISHHSSKQMVQHLQKPVDINKAEAKDLALVKGLGLKKAKAIVEYRQSHGSFKSVKELTKIKGIGLKLLKRIENDITV